MDSLIANTDVEKQGTYVSEFSMNSDHQKSPEYAQDINEECPLEPHVVIKEEISSDEEYCSDDLPMDFNPVEALVKEEVDATINDNSNLIGNKEATDDESMAAESSHVNEDACDLYDESNSIDFETKLHHLLAKTANTNMNVFSSELMKKIISGFHRCDECWKYFYNGSTMEEHMCTQIKVKLTCGHCDKNFVHKSHLNSHLVMHSGEKPFICTVCTKTFSRKSYLNSHLRLHYGDKPFHCNICPRRFNFRSHLTQHLIVHSSDNAFNCKYCNKNFSSKCNLGKHLQIHTGEKPFICPFCDKAFPKKYRLNLHLTVHEGENGKKFVCNYCDKKFAREAYLTAHLFTHSAEKPHTCKQCNKSFAHKSNLNRHLISHTTEKPHVCEHCNRSYAYKTSLRDHLLIHSSRNTSDDIRASQPELEPEPGAKEQEDFGGAGAGAKIFISAGAGNGAIKIFSGSGS